MNSIHLKNLREASERGFPVSEETALAILRCHRDDIPEVCAAATRIRRRYFGDKIISCSIMNAKSGACKEDCAFCAQSSHHRTRAEISPLAQPREILAAYHTVLDLPVEYFGVVTSGESLSKTGVRKVCEVVERERNSRVKWCASFGCLDRHDLKALKEAGFSRFHHNLETAESYYPSVCTTHPYSKRLATVRAVKEVGLEVCCGGILGLGESLDQRVEFAACLAREEVDSIPLNFLIPIPGTKLDHMEPMKPLDMIRNIAMFRLMNPRAEVRVCAGRLHLRDLQAMIFYAGATGIMMGPLLTVAGREVEQDRRMLEDLEFAL
ncbi:MAG: biotin synthase BioB [Syntrophobacteraceae bacterium]|nr:biotin synthase BioB [Syntrophobacteraceae bacterium]